jgi:hypothetical protein
MPEADRPSAEAHRPRRRRGKLQVLELSCSRGRWPRTGGPIRLRPDSLRDEGYGLAGEDDAFVWRRSRHQPQYTSRLQ